MNQVNLGLRKNWKQFTLLVVINAFVGGMVGLERSILPEIAEADALEAPHCRFPYAQSTSPQCHGTTCWQIYIIAKSS